MSKTRRDVLEELCQERLGALLERYRGRFFNNLLRRQLADEVQRYLADITLVDSTFVPPVMVVLQPKGDLGRIHIMDARSVRDLIASGEIEDYLYIEEQVAALRPKAPRERMADALRPLTAIADAYDDNDLDGDARKSWGSNLEHTSQILPKDVVLVSGRGGRGLLTLEHCLEARDALRAGKGGA